jgi:tetratricopeptide (TPR) repeat protein
MRNRALTAVTIIALVGLLAAACGTPAPEAIEPNYTNAACGLSMWYPEDWIYEEGTDQVTFATSEDAITTYPLEAGALMIVVCGDLQNQTFGAWGATLAGYIVSILGLESFVGEARIIGGHEGYLESVEGAFEDGQVIVGFTAAVEYEGWGYFFAAITTQDEMEGYKPVLMGMLDSVQFDASARPKGAAIRTPVPTMPTSQYPPGAYTQGFHHCEHGEYQEAIADFTEAISLEPTFLPSYIGRGNAYCELGEYEEAMVDYNEAIRLDPDYSRAYYSRGDVYRALGEYEEAIADFTEAIRLEPNFLLPYVARGNVYRVLGEYEEAIADFSERILLDSDCAEAYYSRGQCYRELGRYAEAIADFKSYLRLAPPDGEFRTQAQDCIDAMQEHQ